MLADDTNLTKLVLLLAQRICSEVLLTDPKISCLLLTCSSTNGSKKMSQSQKKRYIKKLIASYKHADIIKEKLENISPLKEKSF